MFDPDSLLRKTDRLNFESGAVRDLQEFRQRRKTAAALVLLLLVLGLVLYRHRDFWFAETLDSGQAARYFSAGSAKETAESVELPPIQVEVIASTGHQRLHPRNRSIELSMSGNPPLRSTYEALPMTGTAVEDAASVTSNVAENVRVSVDSAEIVDSSAKLDYPLLARQMKIKGSVILEALIGRDGAIQDLDVVSGAPILAAAAKAAVRQWHFKPRVRGDNTVETNAKIEVNFIISTY